MWRKGPWGTKGLGSSFKTWVILKWHWRQAREKHQWKLGLKTTFLRQEMPYVFLSAADYAHYFIFGVTAKWYTLNSHQVFRNLTSVIISKDFQLWKTMPFYSPDIAILQIKGIIYLFIYFQCTVLKILFNPSHLEYLSNPKSKNINVYFVNILEYPNNSVSNTTLSCAGETQTRFINFSRLQI